MKGSAVGQRSEAVNGGVAEVEGHRVRPVARLDFPDAARDLVEGLVPADARPAVARAPERVLLAVGVDVHVLERGGLRAEKAPAEGVIRVAPDGADPLALHLDAEPAHGFTQVAGSKVEAGLGHGATDPNSGAGLPAPLTPAGH